MGEVPLADVHDHEPRSEGGGVGHLNEGGVDGLRVLRYSREDYWRPLEVREEG